MLPLGKQQDILDFLFDRHEAERAFSRKAVSCGPVCNSCYCAVPFLRQSESGSFTKAGACSHFVAIVGLANRPKNIRTMWQYSVFAFICYVSIHLEIFATVMRSAPERAVRWLRTIFLSQGYFQMPQVRGDRIPTRYLAYEYTVQGGRQMMSDEIHLYDRE